MLELFITLTIIGVIVSIITCRATKICCKKKQPLMPHSKETCVCCWFETDECVDTPISERKYYVESVGQLCEECFKSIYNKQTNGKSNQ